MFLSGRMLKDLELAVAADLEGFAAHGAVDLVVAARRTPPPDGVAVGVHLVQPGSVEAGTHL